MIKDFSFKSYLLLIKCDSGVMSTYFIISWWLILNIFILTLIKSNWLFFLFTKSVFRTVKCKFTDFIARGNSYLNNSKRVGQI